MAWHTPTDDGHRTDRAVLSPGYIARGGLSLGYAMTAHKAEGLTVSADWRQHDGTHQGGTVLVYAPGMDEPGLHVATSRHKDRMYLFAGREEMETINDTREKGVPDTDAQRDGRVIAALAAQARTRSSNANDRPVHDDLGRSPQTAPHRPVGQRPVVPRASAQKTAEAWRKLRALAPRETPSPAPPEQAGGQEQERLDDARRDAAGRAAARRDAARREAARREAARREAARRQDRGRGPRM